MGLCDDSTTITGIVKLFPDSKERTFAWDRTVTLPETAFSRALKAGIDRSSLSARRRHARREKLPFRIAGLAAHYFEEVTDYPPMRRVDFAAATYEGK